MDVILKSLIEGFGNSILPFWRDIIPFAGSVFVLLLIFEILKEAINISTGKGFDMGTKLIVIFFVGTTLLGYGKLSAGIYKAAVEIGDTVITEFGSINKNIEESYIRGSERHEAALEKNGDEAGFFEGFFIGMVTAILSGICLMIMFFIMILILVFIAGAYASLALVLAIGPVFISMLVSSEFRSIGTKWALITLSYLLVIPIYIMVMRMIIELFGQNAYSGNILNPSGVSISASVEQMILLMAGPLISLGLVFSVSKIVDQVIGTAGNFGQTALSAGVSTLLAARVAVKGGVKTLKSVGGSEKKSSGSIRERGSSINAGKGFKQRGVKQRSTQRRSGISVPGKVPGRFSTPSEGLTVSPNPPRISGNISGESSDQVKGNGKFAGLSNSTKEREGKGIDYKSHRRISGEEQKSKIENGFRILDGVGKNPVTGDDEVKNE